MIKWRKIEVAVYLYPKSPLPFRQRLKPIKMWKCSFSGLSNRGAYAIITKFNIICNRKVVSY